MLRICVPELPMQRKREGSGFLIASSMEQSHPCETSTR
jgi:hypothetical protein